MAIYGIDLGTTFCSAAYVERAQPRVVTLENGGPTLPALLRFARAPDSRLLALVGSRARRRDRVRDDSPGLIRGAKNYIGVREHVPGGPPWSIVGRELYATDVAAFVLRALGQIIRAQPELPPLEAVVVTHPQRFRNAEKLATAQAARMAGLELAGMITEPDAAAWAYGLHERASTVGTFMVFDFGGGTLDVTLLRREPGADGAARIHAVGSYGVQLGGAQLDERIFEALIEKYRAQSGDTSFARDGLNDATRERLLDLAEGFKVELNRDAAGDPAPMLRTRARAFAPIADDGSEGEPARLKVTLGELSDWVAGEVDRAVACADEALRRSNWRWNDVEEVLLTGGSSQLIVLQQRIRERCGGRVQVVFEEQDHPLKPSTIVASGAALYAASLGRSDTGVRARVDVRGVVPDAFSVRAYRVDAAAPSGRESVLHSLVEAGTPTPFIGTAQFTRRGAGRSLPVEVFEGRSIHDATSMGTFHVEFDRDVPDGAPVEVQLRVAANGALVLAVHDARSGDWREARLDDAPGLYSENELADRQTWIQNVRIECG